MKKAKSLENTEAGGANGILKNATITLSWKYLSNFGRSLKMQLISCKVKIKITWTKYCLPPASADNVDNWDSDIIFTIKGTKLSVPVVTLSARDNQILPKLLSKGFERSVYWNEYKTKSDNKNTTNEFRYFLESNFVGAHRLFVWVYSNQDADSKRFKAKRYYLPKCIIKNHTHVKKVGHTSEFFLTFTDELQKQTVEVGQ